MERAVSRATPPEGGGSGAPRPGGGAAPAGKAPRAPAAPPTFVVGGPLAPLPAISSPWFSVSAAEQAPSPHVSLTGRHRAPPQVSSPTLERRHSRVSLYAAAEAPPEASPALPRRQPRSWDEVLDTATVAGPLTALDPGGSHARAAAMDPVFLLPANASRRAAPRAEFPTVHVALLLVLSILGVALSIPPSPQAPQTLEAVVRAPGAYARIDLGATPPRGITSAVRVGDEALIRAEGAAWEALGEQTRTEVLSQIYVMTGQPPHLSLVDEGSTLLAEVRLGRYRILPPAGPGPILVGVK